nr:hypothetical protein [Tanacetum cinerariifolium]
SDADVPSQQELDMLFGPLYDEFFNACTNPSTTIPSTLAPSAHTNMHAEENNNDQAEEREDIPDDEFTNPLYKMKEKRDQCILVGYSTRSKGYRVYNMRTRMIVESIHIRFNEIKEVTMATTIEQQVALDEALVPSAQRLRIGRSNFRLPSDIQSKESTLQVVYDVLHRSPFFKAFLVTADVPKIYMQEFWATAYVHQHSIRFKMDTRKNIVDLESFREMLHISPRVPGQSFAELPFEEEILEFLRFLGHNAQIKTLTDVNDPSSLLLFILRTNT